jgi:hypothetical protein
MPQSGWQGKNAELPNDFAQNPAEIKTQGLP